VLVSVTTRAASEGRPVWGVIGGMGPLASAEFMKTIYSASGAAREQDAPVVLLFSDPTLPDRSEVLTNGGDGTLRQCLAASIDALLSLGSTNVVLCCVTAHRVLPGLDARLRDAVMSLVDVLLFAVLDTSDRHLLLCSNGSRASKLFERHVLWPEVSDRIVLPGAGDQQDIHEMIYRLKAGSPPSRELPRLAALLRRHGVRSFAAGCTEFHLVARWLAQGNAPEPLDVIDPLQLVARTIASSTAAGVTHRLI
jgi:aspartate racemase